VIGHNGAGKTTLLRLLSRITEPSEGYFCIRGRVGSLLEVGTGFHPELSGRENVYLSGAILGMTSRQIKDRFDEIIAFAEVERFLETPVKHYSSGMYLRLAFAVAAHLEPDILLVDEVLAVGDAAFQKKCLGKMSDIAGNGRTVLFVSHNLAAVSHLCDQCLWLAAGAVRQQGPAADVIASYLAGAQAAERIDLALRPDRQGEGPLRFTKFWFSDAAGNIIDVLPSGAAVTANIAYVCDGSPARDAIISLRVNDIYGTHLFTTSTHLSEPEPISLASEGVLRCHVPMLPLAAAAYSLDLWAGVAGQTSDFVTGAAQFTVAEADVYDSGRVPVRAKHGPIVVPHRWEASSDSKPLEEQQVSEKSV
jgi:lipopolysaccharide transport system ATP-binding protein